MEPLFAEDQGRPFLLDPLLKGSLDRPQVLGEAW